MTVRTLVSNDMLADALGGFFHSRIYSIVDYYCSGSHWKQLPPNPTRPHLSHNPAHDALGRGSERLVGRQVRPGCAKLGWVCPAGYPLGDFLVNSRPKLLEHRIHGRQILVQRVATAPG